jgi:uncharacterized protein (TIGR04255 family)
MAAETTRTSGQIMVDTEGTSQPSRIRLPYHLGQARAHLPNCWQPLRHGVRMHDMTTTRRYSRSPVIEAIIAIRVELPEVVNVSDLERCQDAAYPIKNPLPLEEPPTSMTSRQGGFLFSNSDQKQVFKAGTEEFMFHQLAPYDGWEPFRTEARRLWAVYHTVARPRAITRVAVRFINEFNVPLFNIDLKEYLRALPEVPPDTFRMVTDFSLELKSPQEDLLALLVVREGTWNSSSRQGPSLLLDIDLFRTTKLPQEETALWAFVEQLHVRAKQVFEGCITDRIRELIR